MIPVITSLTHAMQLAQVEFEQIRGVSAGTYLAGGYLRDSDLGVQPKDRDYFLWAGNQETAEAQVATISGLVGHTFRRLGPAAALQEGYPHGMTVYESDVKPDDAFPINLIFAVGRGMEHPPFDLGICEIYWWAPHETEVYKSNHYRVDVEDGIISVINWQNPRQRLERLTLELYEQDLQHTLGHIKRVQEKYPGRRVLIQHQALPSHTRFWNPEDTSIATLGYDILRKENIIGNPREILPPERQEFAGDPVGQQDRAADLGEIEVRLANRRTVDRATVTRAIEAFTAGLRDQPQIQAGPDDIATAPNGARVVAFNWDVPVAPAPAPAGPNGW